MSAAEINVFLDDGAIHVKQVLPPLLDQEGHEFSLSADEIAEAAKALKAALIAAGMTPSARRSGGGGWGGKKERTPDPVPADLADKVPSHCGEPMEYKAAYKNPQSGRDVGAKFQCVKGEACEQASMFGGKKYGYSIWEDRLRKDIEAELG